MPKYNMKLKKSIVALYQNGKSQDDLNSEYGVSLSSITKWIKQFYEVKIDVDTILSAKQICELQKRNVLIEEENLILKSHCHIHASLKQILDAVHTLRFHHFIKTLCRVLNINRSSYYKHFNYKHSNRSLENQKIKSSILSIYFSSKKHLQVYKINFLLKVEYGLISVFGILIEFLNL